MADPALPINKNTDFDMGFVRQSYGHYSSRGAPQSSWALNDPRIRLLLHGCKRVWKPEIEYRQLAFNGGSTDGTPSEGPGRLVNTMHRDSIVFNQTATVKPGFINATYPASLTGVKVTKTTQQYPAFYDPEGYQLHAETKVVGGDRGDLNLDTLFYYPYGTGSPVYERVALWIYGKWRLTNDTLVDLRLQLLEFKNDWYSTESRTRCDELLADGRSYNDPMRVNDIEVGMQNCSFDYPYKILRFQLKVARYGAPAWQVYAADFSQVCVREVYF